MKTTKTDKKQSVAGMEAHNRLDDNSPVPLYIQLSNLIRADISGGKLRKGDILQSEKILGATYGVSRITVRNALAILVDDGLLYRKRGRGTSVKHAKLIRQSPGLLGIHEEIRASGRAPETKLFSFATIPNPPVEVRKALDIKRNEQVIEIEREINADGELVGMTIAFIPLPVLQKLAIKIEELENHSLYRLLEHGGFKLHEAEETIEVMAASRELAQRLQVREGFPVFSLKRTVFTKDGFPIERGENIFRTDRYAFKIHHWRPVNT